jgi:predicted DNA-binding antitoxin AbrB/MazE fold protein
MDQTIKAVYENGVLRPLSLVFDLAEGQEVLLRLTPVPILDPAEQERRERELAGQLRAKGLLEKCSPPAEGGPGDWQPLTVEGEPLSETIIRLRGERG